MAGQIKMKNWLHSFHIRMSQHYRQLADEEKNRFEETWGNCETVNLKLILENYRSKRKVSELEDLASVHEKAMMDVEKTLK